MSAAAPPIDRAPRPEASHGPGDPNRVGAQSNHDGTHGEGGAEATRIIVAYGFWVFLLSDIIMFAAFFAGFAVLRGNLDGGPSGAQLFDTRLVAWETTLLLASSFTCGMASIAAQARAARWYYAAMVATGLLGAGFLALELSEFTHLVAIGAGPDRSGFLSGFFALVGLHGLHVTLGLLWLATMIAQVWAKGFRDDIQRRILCFALFWHALDIVWVGVFTVVYLMGTA